MDVMPVNPVVVAAKLTLLPGHAETLGIVVTGAFWAGREVIPTDHTTTVRIHIIVLCFIAVSISKRGHGSFNNAEGGLLLLHPVSGSERTKIQPMGLFCKEMK